MAIFTRHSFRSIALLTSSVVLAVVYLSVTARPAAALPCDPEFQVCGALNFSLDTPTPTATGYVIHITDINRSSGTFQVYSCVGTVAVCNAYPVAGSGQWSTAAVVSQPQGPNGEQRFQITVSGLRSGRTYQSITLRITDNVPTVRDTQLSGVTTWPGAQRDATASTTSPSTATLSWTTDTNFSSSTRVYYQKTSPTWEKEPLASYNAHLSPVEGLNDGQAWTGGVDGALWHRSSTGDWTKQTTGAAAINVISAVNGQDVWAADTQGRVYHTSNGGTTWTLGAVASSAILAIHASTPTSVLVGTIDGKIYVYNGTSWSLAYTDTLSRQVRGIYSHDGKTVWAVGENGLFLRRNPAGTWSNSNPFNASANAIAGMNESTLWAAVNDGIYRGVDNGTSVSWNRVVLTNSPMHIRPVSDTEAWFTNSGQVGHYRQGANPEVTLYSEPGVLIGTSISGLAITHAGEVLAAGINATVVSFSLCHPPTAQPGTCAADSVYDPALTTSHSADLTGLTPAKTYYYQAMSSNSTATFATAGTFQTPPLDPIPPTISFTKPVPGSRTYTNQNPYPATGIAGDNIGVQAVTVKNGAVSQPTNVTSPGATSTTWNSIITLNPGANAPVATVTDGSNNVNATADLFYDSTPPTLTITAPANNSSVNQSSIAVSGDATDNTANDSGVASMRIEVNGNLGNPITITPGPAVAWTTTVTLQPGANILAVYVTDQAGNTTTKNVTVTYLVPTFTLTAVTPSRTINGGQTADYTLDLKSVNNFSGDVVLSASGQPSGSTTTYAPVTTAPATVNLTGGQTKTVTMSVATSPTPTGTFTLNISGTSGSITDNDNAVTLIINVAPDYTISAGPSPVSVVAGNPGAFQMTLSANSAFNGTINTFSVVGLHSTMTATFNKPSVTLSPNGSDSSVSATVTTQTSTPAPADYNLEIKTQSGSLAHSAFVTLHVGPAPDFSLQLLPAPPAAQTATAGGPGGASYNGKLIALNGFTGSVNFTTAPTTPVPGLTLSLVPGSSIPSAPAPGTDFILNVTAASNVPAGNYTLRTTGTSGTVTKSVDVQLSVLPDVTPPRITNIRALPTYNSVTVQWDTPDEPSDSKVELFSDAARTAAAGLLIDTSTCTTPAPPALCHNLQLGNLQPLTTYYFTVTSKDQAAPPNSTTRTLEDDNATPLKFTTLDAPDLVKPNIVLDQPADNGGSAIDVGGTLTIQGSATDNKSLAFVAYSLVQDSTGATVPMTSTTCSGVTCSFSQTWNTRTATNGLYTLTVKAVDAANPANESDPAIRILNVFNDLNAPLVDVGPNADVTPMPGQTSCSTTTTDASGNPLTVNQCFQAVITWTTNKPSTSEVDFGLDTNYSGGTAKYDDTDPTNPAAIHVTHSVTIKFLNPQQLYHYRITSCNVSNVCTN